MSDFGETQIDKNNSNQTPSQKVDAWRPMKIDMIENTALELAWSKGITGKSETFVGLDGKVVIGIELTMPITINSIADIYTDLVRDIANNRNVSLTSEEIQSGLNKRRDRNLSPFIDIDHLDIDPNIQRIRLIDFSPQEALPKSLRNIISTQDKQHDPYELIKLTAHPNDNVFERALLNLSMTTGSSKLRSDAIQDLFYDVFSGDKDAIEKFRKATSKNGVEEILIIHGHGNEDDLDIIGEEGFDVIGKDMHVQSSGNRIKLESIISHYENNSKIAVILVSTCYLGNDVPKPSKIPIFRAKGHAGYGHPSRSGYKHVAKIPNSTIIVPATEK